MRALQWFCLVAMVSGCGGVREQFIGTRIADSCDGEWPVCDTTVGCFVGDRSYVQGRFPGSNAVGIRVFEPSEVTVSLYLENIAGAGVSTVINFFETSCSSRLRDEITGKTLVAEQEQVGWIKRSENLSSIGDHQISVESDSRATYLLKVDVLPLRLKDLQ